MAGVKGRSGGSRPGAGRKSAPKRAPVPVAVGPEQDMLKLLQEIALGHIDATTIQVRAAIAAVQYTHPKVGEGGKKEAKQAAAEKVAGRFAPAVPPRLVAAGGKKL